MQGTVAENEVEVAVVLGADECYGCCDAVDVTLERKTRGWQRRRCWSGDEKAERGGAHRQQRRSVLEGLHRPALDAAERSGRCCNMRSGGCRAGGEHGSDDAG